VLNRDKILKERYIQLMDIFTHLSRTLNLLSSKEHYIDSKSSLGKAISDSGEVSTTFLFDTSRVLQRLGLQKFGLSSDEARVYIALMKKGDNGEKVGILNKELDIKRTTIYRIIDRLIKKNWVEKLENPKGTIYIAKPANELVEKIIKEKEKEIGVLKSFQLLLKEYLKNGRGDISQIYGDSQTFGKKIFDIDVLGIMGLEKDFGIIVFEYNNIIIDEGRIQDKLDLVYGKIGQEIDKVKEENKAPDFEDKKIENTKFQEYLGAIIFIKFKEGSKTAKNVGDGWIIAVKLVAIPIENNIYVIWGSEEKFELLMNMILNLK